LNKSLLTNQGEMLISLCSEAQTEILLVSPFIKAPVLQKILTSIKSEVTIKCVTRWFPEEIITGVSDLEVWSIIQSYSDASLWLRNDLHAKYYRADNQCLIGSANLTAKALGWSNQPNLELLVQMPANQPFLQLFEQQLCHNCIQVNNYLYQQYLTLINQLKTQNFAVSKSKLSIELDIANNNIWLPTLRNPEELYLAYSGKIENLTTIACENAISDLKLFSIPSHLEQTAFNNYVGILLLQKPIIQQIDSFVQTPQRFGTVRDFLASLPCTNLPNFNPEHSWQTLMRWLLYFLPSRYALSVPNYSEVFYRIN
jgi:hypothetical protein